MEVPQSLAQNVDVYKRDLYDYKLVHFWEDGTYWRVIRTTSGRAVIQRYSLMLFVWRHQVEGPIAEEMAKIVELRKEEDI